MRPLIRAYAHCLCAILVAQALASLAYATKTNCDNINGFVYRVDEPRTTLARGSHPNHDHAARRSSRFSHF